MSDHPTLLRPTPRRHFTPASTRPSTPPADQDSDRPSLSDRKRSILNLTSSTLFGIYAPSDSPRDGMSTPASGIETPGLRYSIDDNRPPILGAFDKPEFHRRPSQPHITLRNYYLPLSLRTILLFFFGVAYGSVVTHLHDNPQIAPVKVEGIERYTWRYLAFWGLAGIVLGRLLPWVDILWERTMGERRHAVGYFAISSGNASSDEGEGEGERSTSRIESVLGADWNPAVRSIGAFVGIAFAIRRLPWQSTLQVSLTLAMVNPALWYIVDRSRTGFVLSTIVGIAGTAVLLSINPSIVPAPPTPSPRAHAHPLTDMSYGHLDHGFNLISNESIAVSTWIASVLFCSSVCFGNIGRRLTLDGEGKRDFPE
ncbi:MAG: hypothetical protein LQ350_003496 [Teloschistes chrysophthalmus]|nr:MAG: hypothetical protein LQ350_003496 [Niorma chrysophthalma]